MQIKLIGKSKEDKTSRMWCNAQSKLYPVKTVKSELNVITFSLREVGRKGCMLGHLKFHTCDMMEMELTSFGK